MKKAGAITGTGSPDASGGASFAPYAGNHTSRTDSDLLEPLAAGSPPMFSRGPLGGDCQQVQRLASPPFFNSYHYAHLHLLRLVHRLGRDETNGDWAWSADRTLVAGNQK